MGWLFPGFFLGEKVTIFWRSRLDKRVLLEVLHHIISRCHKCEKKQVKAVDMYIWFIVFHFFIDMTCAYIDIVILIYYCDYHSYLCLFIIAIFVGIYIYNLCLSKKHQAVGWKKSRRGKYPYQRTLMGNSYISPISRGYLWVSYPQKSQGWTQHRY